MLSLNDCPLDAALSLEYLADAIDVPLSEYRPNEARESLNITTLLCANRSYMILEAEFKRAQGRRPADQDVLSLMELKDWVEVSQGMGVPAEAVDTAEEMAAAITRALAEPGPNLIQMNL